MKAYIVEAKLAGAQSPVPTYHLVTAQDPDEAVRLVQEEMALFDEGVTLLDELSPGEAQAAHVDLSTSGYRRRWTLASRGER